LCNNCSRNSFFIGAIRRGKPHPALTEFRLCKELGKLPSEIRRESAKDIETFIVILNEMDRQTAEEMEKAKKHVR